MTIQGPLLIKVAAVAVLAGLAGVLLLKKFADRDLARRLESVLRDNDENTPSKGVIFALVSLVGRIGASIQRLSIFSKSDLAELERTARSAGYDPETAVPLVIGGKLLLIILGPLVGYAAGREFAAPWPIVAAACGACLGLFGPNFAVSYSRKSRLKALRIGLSDALDLLVVCAEAGLGLESAINRVAAEMDSSHPEIASEFSALSQDLRLSSDRGAALLRMGERAGLESFQRLTMTLAQTLRYGTPLGQALRTLAIEMRNDRLLALEEKAARLPTLLMIPLAAFILPCLFIVVAGPAALRIMRYML